MAETVNLKAVISAEDRASSTIAGLGNQFARLGQVVGGLAIGNKVKSEMDKAISASNSFQGSMIGLSSVASAFGQNAGSATEAARKLATDGLMTVNDAATSLKNLLASGFNLDQAITLVTRFKDTAAFGRQSALSFGEAISTATQGIKNGNSIMVDNAGVTKNLSIILEEAGYSQQDLMRATSDTGVRTALFNGIVKETIPQLGDAARLSSTFSGAQSRLATAVFNTRAKIGELVTAGLTPLVSGITEFITKNQGLVVALAVAVGAAGAFAAAIVGVGGAIALAVSIMGGPFTLLLAAVSVLLGVVVFQAVQKVQQQMAKTSKGFQEGTNKIKQASNEDLEAAKKKARELAEKLGDIDDQMKKTTRDFRESLAQIVVDHRQKVDDIKKQLTEENTAFTEAQSAKSLDFKTSNDELVRNHRDKVSEIESQIKEELIAGTNANAQRINDLRVRLAQENEAYNKQVADNEAKYNDDAAKAMLAHEKKKTDLQIQLDAETAFLNKHNADIASIRDVQLLDEIDKLKRSHVEQMAEFAKQKTRILQNSKETGAGSIAANNQALLSGANAHLLDKVGLDMGRNLSNAIKNGFNEWKGRIWQDIKDLGEEIGTFFKIVAHYGYGLTQEGSKKIAPTWNEYLKTGNVKYRAMGGEVSGGQPYVVGEKGPEWFIPRTGGQIVPNSPSGGNITANVTVSGVFMGTPAEGRKLAQMVADHLQDIAGAKNMSASQLLGG